MEAKLRRRDIITYGNCDSNLGEVKRQKKCSTSTAPFTLKGQLSLSAAAFPNVPADFRRNFGSYRQQPWTEKIKRFELINKRTEVVEVNNGIYVDN